MTDKQIEKILKNAKVSMEVEGFAIEPELEDVGRRIVTGELDINVYISDYIARYRQAGSANEV